MLIFKTVVKILKEQRFPGKLTFALGLERVLQCRKASQAKGREPVKARRWKCLQFTASWRSGEWYGIYRKVWIRQEWRQYGDWGEDPLSYSVSLVCLLTHTVCLPCSEVGWVKCVRLFSPIMVVNVYVLGTSSTASQREKPSLPWQALLRTSTQVQGALLIMSASWSLVWIRLLGEQSTFTITLDLAPETI